jgi:hypothetical protein
MAELTNKLHIKKDGVDYECTCYTTVEEATPVAIPGGSAWEIKNNGVVCYVGLWPINENGGDYHTPLRHRKDGVEYWVDSQVANSVTVIITQSDNQIIRVTCNGQVYTQTFEAPAGSLISVAVEPAIGYTAGAPSISSGYVTAGLEITASPASKATYLVTIEPAAGYTLIVTCNGVEYTSSFTAEYGDTWTAVGYTDDGYKIVDPRLVETSGVITGNTVISAPSTVRVFYSLVGTKPDKAVLTVNGIEGTTFAVASGTEVQLESVAEQYHVTDALYLDAARLIIYQYAAPQGTDIIDTIVVNELNGTRVFTCDDLDKNNEIKFWVNAVGDTVITTNFTGNWYIAPTTVTSGSDTVVVLVDNVTEPVTKEIVLEPPFTENTDYLTNLLGNDISIKSTGLRWSPRGGGGSYPYIEFVTPKDEDIFVSITGGLDDMFYTRVYITNELVYPYTDATEVIPLVEMFGDGPRTCTLPSGVLKPMTKYYIVFVSTFYCYIYNIKLNVRG